MLTRVCVPIVLGVVLLFAAPARAAESPPSCTTRDQMLSALAQRFGETPSFRAITYGGAMLEIVTSGATWTAILTTPGDHCATLLDFGTDWRDVRIVGKPS